MKSLEARLNPSLYQYKVLLQPTGLAVLGRGRTTVVGGALGGVVELARPHLARGTPNRRHVGRETALAASLRGHVHRRTTHAGGHAVRKASEAHVANGREPAVG